MMSADLSHELCSTQLGLPKDSTAVFADLARAGSNSYLAVLLVREADGGTSVGRWRVNGEGGSFSMTKVRWDTLQYPSSGAKGEKKTGDLLTCALHCPPPESTMQPSLSVVWDSLVWQRFRVGTGSSPTLETTFHVHGAAPMPRAARSKGGAPPGAKGVVATLGPCEQRANCRQGVTSLAIKITIFNEVARALTATTWSVWHQVATILTAVSNGYGECKMDFRSQAYVLHQRISIGS